jgi:trehalose 6-phosphate synthase
MVTPLRDGMNLVAKEYLAAQDPGNPGVLMLSQFAGAAKELDRALIVNPHETDAVAAALKRALGMPLEERRERHAPMLDHLMQDDIKKWAKSYLSTLAGGLPKHSLLDGIRSLFSAGSDPTLLAFRRGTNANLAIGADAEKRLIPAAVSLRAPDVRGPSSFFR